MWVLIFFVFYLQFSEDELNDNVDDLIPEEKRRLRWFLTSSEALSVMKSGNYSSISNTMNKTDSPVFRPRPPSIRRRSIDDAYRKSIQRLLSWSNKTQTFHSIGFISLDWKTSLCVYISRYFLNYLYTKYIMQQKMVIVISLSNNRFIH